MEKAMLWSMPWDIIFNSDWRQDVKKKRIIKLKHLSYQPKKAELEKKIRIKATPEEFAKALMQDVEIKYEEWGVVRYLGI